MALRDLGEHRLRDIAHTEHLFDVVIDGLPSDFPPIRSLDVRPNNLPLQLTSFVGRADEIAHAMRLLADHRLVTLTGPGGSGKAAGPSGSERRPASLPDNGVYFVDLAPLSDHTQVPSVIAQALAIREQKGRHLIDTLVDGLAATDVLLVLDNFEHVLSAAWVADRLLGEAPKLRILATSRAPLRLYGEQELRSHRSRCPISVTRMSSWSCLGTKRSHYSSNGLALLLRLRPERWERPPRG